MSAWSWTAGQEAFFIHVCHKDLGDLVLQVKAFDCDPGMLPVSNSYLANKLKALSMFMVNTWLGSTKKKKKKNYSWIIQDLIRFPFYLLWANVPDLFELQGSLSGCFKMVQQTMQLYFICR